jgi:hypothetical protein
MTLPDVDQLLEDAFEHPLFPCLMEGRVPGEHPVFGGSEFLPAELFGHHYQNTSSFGRGQGKLIPSAAPMRNRTAFESASGAQVP